jgi:molybdopterin synthase catalytic subunit
MLHVKIIDATKEKIDLAKAQKFIASSKCGASIYFVGTVRDQNNDKKVTGITYDSHDALVIKSFEEIYKEAETKFKFNNIAVYIEHIKGYVELGETSIIIAVACKHRSQAYEFSRYVIEEIKKRTPIWKKEHYEEEDSKWLKGNPLIDQNQLK